MAAARRHPDGVEGPVTGGRHGWAFAEPTADLAAAGYRLEEWIVSGEADRFRPAAGTELGIDGRWQVETAGSLPYRTRLLIWRPEDPARFSGTVVVHWNNVTAGFELFGGDSAEVLSGHAFVAASVQRVGVHGFARAPMGLVAWDPERYGSLSIPTDDISYDLFTQVAAAVGADRPTAGRADDPLGGLAVHRLVAMGASQSAGRLRTYHNAVQPRTGAFDAFLLLIHFCRAMPLEVGDRVVSIVHRTADRVVPEILASGERLRDDLDVPVLMVNSELEARATAGVRQPDGDRFRWWEAAGTSHQSLPVMRVRAAKFERDFRMALPVDDRMNRVTMEPLNDAALAAVHRWLTAGEPPPVHPRIDIARSPDGTHLAEPRRDELGIATGGIRLPQVVLPLRRHSSEPLATDAFALLRGSSMALPRSWLLGRYGSEDRYLQAFRAATDGAVTAGVVPARDIERLVAQAADDWADAPAD